MNNKKNGAIDREVFLLLGVMVASLVPVLVLWAAFDQLNVLVGQGFMNVLTIGGPIGAYVVLVQMTYRFLVKSRASRSSSGAKLLPRSELPVPAEIAGKWVGEWTWTDENKRKSETYKELWEIEQQGPLVHGTIQGEQGLDARFRGEIVGRTVSVHFVTIKKKRLSCGAVCLTIDEEGSAKMAGHQTFYALDQDLRRVVATPYKMTKR